MTPESQNSLLQRQRLGKQVPAKMKADAKYIVRQRIDKYAYNNTGIVGMCFRCGLYEVGYKEELI
jgi:hypothetical protein